MDVVLYHTDDGKTQLEVQLDRDMVWLSQRQMADLFEKDTDTIGLHIRNIYKEGELPREGTAEESSVVQDEGGRQVRRQVHFYNLDVIISVGYRVKSKRGTQFRQWATRVLKEHLIRGFTINEQRLEEQNEKLIDLRRTVSLLEKTFMNQVIGLDEAKGLLQVITDYAYALTTLDRYDHGTLAIEQTTQLAPYVLTYEAAMKIVESMKSGFGGLFGVEKDEGLRSGLGAVYQTFGGQELYPSIEEKAAHLLYFVVKNHAFIDGNKRIGAALFIMFMAGNGQLYRADGSKRIADNALVALTLLIAESKPEEMETVIKVIVSAINRSNE
jgi:prophage maintenance system killer protein